MAVKTITIGQVYQLLKDAVKHSTGAEPCQRLNTFAVLQSMQELSTENLGKFMCDADKNFFYSRLWESLSSNPSKIVFEWPILSVFEENYNYKEPFGQRTEKCYNLQLHVLDQFAENDTHTDCTGCKGRVVNDIYADTEMLLDKVLQYISNVHHITLSGTDRLINKTYYAYLIAQVPNTLAGAVINEPVGRSFATMLRQENKDRSAFRKEGKAASLLYGTVFPLRVCLDQCIDYTPVISDFSPAKIPDVGCC